jgi:YfiH family protein
MTAPPRLDAGATDLGGGFVVEARAGGARVVKVPALDAAGVAALMTTIEVNARSDDEVARWARDAGLVPGVPLASVRQVHGTTIVQVPPLRPDTDADGMWSDVRDVALAVRAADCAPVWLADQKSRRFMLLHAGWRGVAAGIMSFGVAQLRTLGSKPAHLMAAVGPHLQACCFEIGPEVAPRFTRWPQALRPAQSLEIAPKRRDSVALDLGAVITAQLREADVRTDHIFRATACTRCNDRLFHSYRRNGAGGPLMAAIAVRVS